jgi:molybdopterin-guanine dinucleotide biosynthesis protein
MRRHQGRRRRLLVRLRRLIVDVVVLESFRVGVDAPVPSIVLAVEVAAPSVVPFG